MFDFESRKDPLASSEKFLARLMNCIGFGILFMSMVLLIGMLGYHFIEDMSWINAFTNSALTLADMGLITPVTTDAGKIFAGIFALLSGLIFFSVIGIIFAPIIHRIFHKFHLNSDSDEEK